MAALSINLIVVFTVPLFSGEKIVLGEDNQLKEQLEQIKDFLADSQYQKATQLAQQLLDQNPDHVEAKKLYETSSERLAAANRYIAEAEMLEIEGDFLRAYRVWLKILEISPFDQRVRVKADQLSKIAKKEIRVLYRRIIKHFQAHRFQKALGRCRTILELYPENTKFQTVIDKIEEVLKAANNLVAQAQEGFAKNDWDLVLEKCKDCLFVSPLHEEARTLYEEAYIKWKMSDAGEKVYPTLPELLEQLGVDLKAPPEEERPGRSEEEEWQLKTQLDVSQEAYDMKTSLNIEVDRVRDEFEGFSV